MAETGSGEWPFRGLDVAALQDSGWRPVPISEVVLKVHGRCNLACDYCYVYEGEDQSWRTRPAAMSSEVIAATAARLAEHAREHALPKVTVVLHGGEPLLAGRASLAETITLIRAAMPSTCEVEMCTQTNGVLLTDAMLAMLDEHDVGVSVSLDGDREGHDRHRLRANGRGSHADVMRGLNRLAGSYRRLYQGLLCTVDLDNDPVRTYEALMETRPPGMDFLLPHGTWQAPPPRRPVEGGGTPYADWLIAVFDRWYHAPRKETGVRLFEEIINLLLGGQSRSENIGLSPSPCSSSTPTERSSRSTRSRSPTPAHPRPASPSSTTVSTTRCCIPAWSRVRSDGRRCRPRARRARYVTSAAEAATHIATGRATATSTRPCTALTC
ncbi:radical SAM protein [Actinomadura madurae]|uniref:radical SAM protein n=1 Tax=Actinomadura madurae TaxID=1993 RepID=UPI0020D216FE|nr:radical SAM protein [Actinomadura madurae]MCQ0015909.1 radical SAM protein [Actinomadura madurae]